MPRYVLVNETLYHDTCVPKGATITEHHVSPDQPSQSDYEDDASYEAALDAAFLCNGCNAYESPEKATAEDEDDLE